MKDIRFLVMDVDGTLTDGKIYMGPDGEVCKAFHIKDGYGIGVMLPAMRVRPVIITGRKSVILENRCREIGVTDIHQGISDKLGVLRRVTGDLKAVAFIGDDLNDLECMQSVKDAGGLVGCPADAARGVREIADFIAPSAGGCGAVRDFIEWLND